MSDYDPTDLHQQEQRADDRHVASLLASDAENSDIVWLMSGLKGRRFVRRLLEDAGVMRSSFCPNAMQMAFREGQKDMGIKLLAKIQQLCPKDYPTMMQEYKNGRAVASDRSNSNN